MTYLGTAPVTVKEYASEIRDTREHWNSGVANRLRMFKLWIKGLDAMGAERRGRAGPLSSRLRSRLHLLRYCRLLFIRQLWITPLGQKQRSGDHVHRLLVVVRFEQVAVAVHRHLQAAMAFEGLHRLRLPVCPICTLQRAGVMRLRSAARRTSSLVAGRPGLEWGADSSMPFHSNPQRLRDTLRFSI